MTIHLGTPTFPHVNPTLYNDPTFDAKLATDKRISRDPQPKDESKAKL